MGEERFARHLVARGEAQHLAAERGQAAVIAVELVDEIFDLGVVELHAFDLRGQLLAQLVIFLLRRRREFARGRQSLEPRVLQLREGLDARSEERRVGKAWVSPCRDRWSTYH